MFRVREEGWSTFLQNVDNNLPDWYAISKDCNVLSKLIGTLYFARIRKVLQLVMSNKAIMGPSNATVPLLLFRC
jgi:hypothetical protein